MINCIRTLCSRQAGGRASDHRARAESTNGRHPTDVAQIVTPDIPTDYLDGRMKQEAVQSVCHRRIASPRSIDYLVTVSAPIPVNTTTLSRRGRRKKPALAFVLPCQRVDEFNLSQARTHARTSSTLTVNGELLNLSAELY